MASFSPISYFPGAQLNTFHLLAGTITALAIPVTGLANNKPTLNAIR